MRWYKEGLPKKKGLPGGIKWGTGVHGANNADVWDYFGLDAYTLGQETLALQIDVTEKADIEQMVKETVARFGRIDILVNNAGVGRSYPLLMLMKKPGNW